MLYTYTIETNLLITCEFNLFVYLLTFFLLGVHGGRSREVCECVFVDKLQVPISLDTSKRNLNLLYFPLSIFFSAYIRRINYAYTNTSVF